MCDGIYTVSGHKVMAYPAETKIDGRAFPIQTLYPMRTITPLLCTGECQFRSYTTKLIHNIASTQRFFLLNGVLLFLSQAQHLKKLFFTNHTDTESCENEKSKLWTENEQVV